MSTAGHDALFLCKVCLDHKSRSEMRHSSRGRLMHHCRACAGRYRCIHCNAVKTSDNFKTHSGQRYRFQFDDGEEQRIAVCYSCDYALNRQRYARYDKRVQQEESIKAIILNNLQAYRIRARKAGIPCDLDRDFLTCLWNQQHGRCVYTDLPISLARGRGQWDSASLDRIDPTLGYIRGNVAWTTRLVNTTKGQRTADEFIAFCSLVVRHHAARP